MAIKMDDDKEKYCLSIDGDLTIYKAQEYKTFLVENYIAEKTLEVDLQGVEEIDTCGLQLLAAMNKQLLNHGAALKIIAASDVAKEALRLSHVITGITFNEEGAAQ